MATPEVAAANIRKKGSALGAAANALGAQVGIAIGKSLVTLTPSDTGAAKSNWQGSRVRPRTVKRTAYAVGEFSKTDSANEAAAIAQITSQFKARKKNQPLYITNGLHYIGRLEESYNEIKRESPTPPARHKSGFFIIAVQEGKNVLRNTKLIRQALTNAGVTGFRIEIV
jgi:hypothetical protein